MDDDHDILKRGWHFPPSFDYHSKSVEMISGSHDIKESLMILLSTIPEERIMESDYGCDLSPLAFQTLDLNLETFMINNIKQAIADYEPRVNVQEVYLAMQNELEGVITITVHYTIVATNEKDSVVYDYQP